MTMNMREVDSALTDLEGLLHAIELVRMDGALNKPGPECHALAVLSKVAVEKAAELRHAIYPNDVPEKPRQNAEATP